MKKNAVIFTVLICSVLFLSACQNLFSPGKEISEYAETQNISGPLLAQIGDWKIGLNDFNERLDALRPLAAQQDMDIDNYDFKREVLNELVRQALLAQEAEKRGLDEDPEVKASLTQYEQTLLAQQLIADETRGIEVTDVEIQNFYEQNKDYFKKPAEVKVREIVLASDASATGLYVDILTGKTSFSAAAQQKSIAGSATKGGDLGYISYNPDNKFPKFWDMVLSLDEGEISKFKGPEGKSYIVKVEDKKEGKTTPLAEVKEDIKTALQTQKVNRKIEDLVNSAKQSTDFVINEDLLR